MDRRGEMASVLVSDKVSAAFLLDVGIFVNGLLHRGEVAVIGAGIGLALDLNDDPAAV